MVNKPTHISGSLIDHAYVEKLSMDKLSTNVIS